MMKKNILAKNLLRFGVKNLNENNIFKLQNHNRYFLIEAQEEQWINVTAPNIGVAFAAGASNSKSFINDIWTKLKAAIDANPAAKALYDAKNLAVQSLTVYAGASNNYNNKPTQYDTGNWQAKELAEWGKYNDDGSPEGSRDMFNTALLAKKGVNTKFTDADMQSGYKLNLELAKKRGLDIATNLKATMIANGILIPDATQGQFYSENILPAVIDTQGFLDKNRDMREAPNPGQMATIVVELSGKQMVTKVPTSIETLKTGLQNKSVLWGSYKNTDSNQINTFELKYLPGQGKGQDTFVMPVVRWTFEYDANGQVNKVNQIPDPGKKGVPNSVLTDFPAKETILNPPGKATLEAQVPHVVQLLTAAGIYSTYFPA